MKEASIEIETFDLHAFVKDFGEEKIRIGSEIEIAKGTYIRFESVTLREAVGVPQLLELVLAVAERIALPVALGIASNWLYERIRSRNVVKIRIGGHEVEMDKDRIKEILMNEIKTKPPMKKYFVNLSFPEFSKDEMKQAARTLTNRPIIFNENELSYPDNTVFFAKYISGNVEAIVHIRNEEVNELCERGRPIYTTAKTSETTNI